MDLGYFDIDGEVAANILAAAEALRDAGAIVEEVDIGWDRELGPGVLVRVGFSTAWLAALVYSISPVGNWNWNVTRGSKVRGSPVIVEVTSMSLGSYLKAPFRAIGKRYVRSRCEDDRTASQNGSFIGGQNERPVEYAFALQALNDYTPKKILDVGTGKTAWPHLLASCGFAVTAIDQVENYWRDDLTNRHWSVENDDICNPSLSGQFDAITCLSVLEHIPAHLEAVKGMFSLLSREGIIVITAPYNRETYHPNVNEAAESSYQSRNYVTQSYSRTELDKWCTDNDADVVAEKYYTAFSGNLWSFGERLLPLRNVNPEGAHQLGCFVLRKHA